MRWNNLFDDLESQLESEMNAVSRHQDVDEERQRHAQLTMHDRLRNLTVVPKRAGITGRDERRSYDPVVVALTSGLVLSLVPLRHGKDWCAVDIHSPTSLAGQALLPIAAVESLLPTADQLTESLGKRVLAERVSQPESIAHRIGLGYVLRDLSRRRKTVEIHCAGSIYRGTLDRVSMDHCELAEHAVDEPRRRASVSRVRLLSLSRIILVRVF